MPTSSTLTHRRLSRIMALGHAIGVRSLIIFTLGIGASNVKVQGHLTLGLPLVRGGSGATPPRVSTTRKLRSYYGLLKSRNTEPRTLKYTQVEMSKKPCRLPPLHRSCRLPAYIRGLGAPSSISPRTARARHARLGSYLAARRLTRGAKQYPQPQSPGSALTPRRRIPP